MHSNRWKVATLVFIGWILIAGYPPVRWSQTAPSLAFASGTPSSEEIENRFNSVIFGAVSTWKMPWADECEATIRGMIHRGAQQLVHDGATSERIALAEANARRFADELVQETLADGLDMIGPEVLAKVRQKLCPCYPIC
jgi:hypothetical protein